MRIGLIAWERFSYGGVSRIISSIVKELSCHTDIEIKVLCLKKEKFFQNVYGIDTQKVEFSFMELTPFQKLRREIANKMFSGIVKTGINNLLYLFPYIKYADSYLNKIASWINTNSFDIVMFSSGFEDSIQLAAIKERINNNIKLISWSHASFKDYFRKDKGLLAIGQRKLWKYYYKRFDSIVVLSDADVRNCKEYLDLPAIRIYNSNSFLPSHRTTLNHKRFVYVGSLSYNKGYDLMVDAFIEFAKKNRDWDIDIYGEGEGRIYVENSISKNNLADRMHLYDYTNDIETIYSKHDVLIFPSRYEGFGIVQIEAASCGLPVIASDIPITNELIGKYQYGTLFKWNNAHSLAETMLQFISSDFSKYSENAIEAAKDFKVDIITQEWVKMFKSLIYGKSN